MDSEMLVLSQFSLETPEHQVSRLNSKQKSQNILGPDVSS